eukprot:scaffold1567_cov106-Isochrysis_galbana.AAC.14
MSQSRSERAGKAGDVRLDVTRKRLANLDADGARYLLGIREGVCESGRKRRDELGQIGGERRSGALADVTEELEQLQPQLLRRLGLRRADTARHARQDVCERGQERLHRERLDFRSGARSDRSHSADSTSLSPASDCREAVSLVRARLRVVRSASDRQLTSR